MKNQKEIDLNQGCFHIFTPERTVKDDLSGILKVLSAVTIVSVSVLKLGFFF